MTGTLGPERLEDVREALRRMELDGWLLYDFHGRNPVAVSLLGLTGPTRRSFAYLPADDDPVVLMHAIEASAWQGWPWERRHYRGWKEMEEGVTELLDGARRVAMETSPRSAVPTLDLVPAGVAELVLATGVEIVSSGDLVTTFHSRWSKAQLRTHRKTAATVREVAMEAFERAAAGARKGAPLLEGELASWIRHRLPERGITHEVDCIVAIGPNAADPHYHPADRGSSIDPGELLLVDLWGKPGPDQVPADQTWMGFLGSKLPSHLEEVWRAVRGARDRALSFLHERARGGEPLRGWQVDRACRAYLEERGFGPNFLHRTGHSIDRDLHGSGPNLDDLETRDERILLPGVGFSVEPGVYMRDEVGMRSEVNVYLGQSGPEVTTPHPQQEVLLLPVG